MAAVVQLTKILTAPPLAPMLPDVTIRTYRGPEDIPAWLDLRHRAFARQSVGVRAWGEHDFAAELLHKPWWSPDRFWLAETTAELPARRVVGAVALAERSAGRPAVHWLMVDPAYRRRGIAQALMATLEAACWQAGQRQVWLETHAAWRSAAQLYQALGYTQAAGPE